MTDEQPYEGRYCLKVANRRFFHSGPGLFLDKAKLAGAGPGVYRISFAVKTMEEMQLRLPVIIEGKAETSYSGAGTRRMGPQDGWVQYSREARVDWKGDLAFVRNQRAANHIVFHVHYRHTIFFRCQVIHHVSNVSGIEI